MNRVFWLLVFPMICFGKESALFYPAHGGRTGDKLIHYVKALWVSHKSGLPLYMQPFSFSEYLDLYYTTLHYKEGMENDYQMRETIKSLGAINSSTDEDTWIEVGFFFRGTRWSPYEVGTWTHLLEDKVFRTLLRQKIRLVRPFHQVPPKDCGITVALHIREGGGCDAPRYSRSYFSEKAGEIPSQERRKVCPKVGVAEENFPHKFPPMQFYLDALKQLCEKLLGEQLYVFVFTDAQDPRQLIDGLGERLSGYPITFDCHQTPTGPATRVLEDMIAMSRYDVLIRGGSNYPQISHLIGEHKLVIYPLDYFWHHDCLHMHPVQFHLDLSNLSSDDRYHLVWRNFKL